MNVEPSMPNAWRASGRFGLTSQKDSPAAQTLLAGVPTPPRETLLPSHGDAAIAEPPDVTLIGAGPAPVPLLFRYHGQRCHYFFDVRRGEGGYC